jgi:electron transport complex protein RnfE
VQLILQAYIPELYTQLGVFLSLITVNCIVFARAEAFASKNNPLTSALDGLGMGLGFTLALFIISTVRELLGAGTVLSGTPFEVTIPLEKLGAQPMLLFILPAGGFFTFGMVIAAVNVIRAKVGDARAVRDLSDCDDNCGGCPVAETCGKARV